MTDLSAQYKRLFSAAEDLADLAAKAAKSGKVAEQLNTGALKQSLDTLLACMPQNLYTQRISSSLE